MKVRCLRHIEDLSPTVGHFTKPPYPFYITILPDLSLSFQLHRL
jgi:hypothetical protein